MLLPGSSSRNVTSTTRKRYRSERIRMRVRNWQFGRKKDPQSPRSLLRVFMLLGKSHCSVDSDPTSSQRRRGGSAGMYRLEFCNGRQSPCVITHIISPPTLHGWAGRAYTKVIQAGNCHVFFIGPKRRFSKLGREGNRCHGRSLGIGMYSRECTPLPQNARVREPSGVAGLWVRGIDGGAMVSACMCMSRLELWLLEEIQDRQLVIYSQE